MIIATTRPETIMADTGVCVHPEDERYAGLVGKKIIVPIVGRAVPLFADRYVDKEFGTGALKVTPCHDPNDWTLGERHGLEFIQCIDEDGNMTAERAVCGPVQGRVPQAHRRGFAGFRPAREDRGSRSQRGALLPLQDRGRAAYVRTVVRGFHEARAPRPRRRAGNDPDLP